MGNLRINDKKLDVTDFSATFHGDKC